MHEKCNSIVFRAYLKRGLIHERLLSAAFALRVPSSFKSLQGHAETLNSYVKTFSSDSAEFTEYIYSSKSYQTDDERHYFMVRYLPYQLYKHAYSMRALLRLFALHITFQVEVSPSK